MSIAIHGAGAIGGIVAADLSRSGEDVLCVDRVPEHVAAINASGLRVTRAAEFTARVPPRGAARPPRPHLPRREVAGHRGGPRRPGPPRRSRHGGRVPEVDHMIGRVVAEARRQGLDAPLMDHLRRQVKEIEAGTRPRGLASLDELERRRRALAAAPAPR